MRRAFIASDNQKRFTWAGRAGRLEYPLTDPEGSRPGEGILWFDAPDTNRWGWTYVLPVDVDPDGWIAEGTPTERHTPGQPELTPLDYKIYGGRHVTDD